MLFRHCFAEFSWRDIEMGGRDSSVVQGSLAEGSRCILGKRFSVALGVAPQQVWMTRRLASLIARLLVRTPSPWEISRYLILAIRGAINYVPLIGISRPLQPTWILLARVFPGCCIVRTRWFLRVIIGWRFWPFVHPGFIYPGYCSGAYGPPSRGF